MTVPSSLSDVPDVTPYIQYVATSSQTVFPYPFPITQDSDLVCVVNGATLATDAGYTLSGVGDDTGGDLTFSVGRTAGDIVTIYRDITIERLTQISQNSGLSSELFNFEFNNIYLIMQQLEDNISRCLQVPNTNNPAPTTTLVAANYANKYLSFDANGNPAPAALTSSGSLTQAIVGSLLYPRTAAEITAGVTPASYWYSFGNAKRYGAAGDGSTDDSTATQNMLACVAANGGGTAYIPAGTYIVKALSWPPGVSIIGEPASSFGATISTLYGSVLKLKASANVPMIQNDRSGTVLGTNIDGSNNTATMASIENIVFDGNSGNQSSLDADIIRLTGSWGASFRKCAFRSAYGWGVRAYDCNVLSIVDCNLVTAPIYVEHWADSVIRNNQIGSGTTLIYPLIWLSGRGGSSPGTFQDIITSNFIYNNAGNTAIALPTFTADAATDIITTSVSHGWVDSTPVVCTTTSALPAGLSPGVTYYFKSLSANTGKLATSRANLAAGTYVDITSAGTGTHTIGIGENAALYANDAVHWLTINGNRFDQNYGNAILLRNSYENTFVGNLVNGCGMSTVPINSSGIKMLGSYRNVFSGNNVNGTVYTSAGRTSQQNIGFEGDATSIDNIGNLNAQAMNHSTANVQMADGYKTDEAEESIYLQAGQFQAVAATAPTLGSIAGNRRYAWLLDKDLDEQIATWFQVPKHWAGFQVTLVWTNNGAGSGNVTWAVSGGNFAAASNLNVSDPDSPAAFVTTAPAQLIVSEDAVPFSHVFAATALSNYSLRIKRVGSDGGDTLANDAGLLAVKLTRANP